MKKLKRSRAAKITAFVLIMLLVYGALGNAAMLYIAYRNNMMNVSKEAFNNKIYSYFAEQTSNEAIRYFYLKDSRKKTETENKSYYDSEIELYESKFSRENTNAAFVIKDENGKVLLKNFDPENTAYRFDRTFTYTISPSVQTSVPPRQSEVSSAYYNEASSAYYEEGTDIGATLSAPAAPANEETPTVQTEADAPTESTTAVRQQPNAEETATTPQPADASAATGTTMPPEEYTTTEYPGEISFYIVDEGRDDGRLFRFVYGTEEGIRDDVLAFCQADYENLREYEQNYEDDGFSTYFQDDFTVSANGVVYYEGNGTLRLAYEWNTYPEDFSKVYSISVFVAEDLTAKDMYRLASALGNFAYGYKDVAVPVTVALVGLGIALYIFLLYAAGWTKTAEGPVCRGWHRFPFDLTCVVFAVLAAYLFLVVYDSFSYSGLIALCVFALPAASLLFICFTESLAVRLKTHSIKESLLIVKLFRFVKKCGGVVSKNINILWKVGVYYVVSGILSCFAIAIFHHELGIMLIVYLLFKLAELPLLSICAVNVYTLQKGAEEFANGTATKPVGGPLLFGGFKTHAANLNRMQNGVDRAVEERMKSESMKTELITNVSHDLKTPLTSIVNYIDLLKKEDVQNPQAQEYIEVIDRQAQRLKKLTTDIVDASKAATGSMPMQPEPTDLGVMLQQVCGEYEETLKAQGLQTVVSCPQERSVIYADGKLLWRVFDNLLNNVSKYAMPGTRVYLSLTNEGNCAQVVFRNISGSPLNISPEELTERFVRGDASRNTEGSGLGLSISKSLTENMGGTFGIDIDGDLFKVTLRFPLLESEAQA